jgi:predicted transposase YbfD/YdcC
LSGERFLDVIRAHWGVENRLHWRLARLSGFVDF